MAHVRRHPKTGKWQVRYVDPWRKERSRTFSRKSDAEAFKSTVEVAVRSGAYVDPERGRISIREWSAYWFDVRVGVRPSTHARDASYIRSYIVSELGDVRIGDLTFEMVQYWVSRLEAKSLAPATIKKAHQLLSQMLEHAIRAQRIRWNPATGVVLPAARVTQERRFLTMDEVGALADAIDPRYRVLVSTAAYTGARWGELAGLAVESVNLLRRHMTIERTLSEVRGEVTLGHPKTAASRRQVTLPRFLVDELATHIASVPPGPDGVIFTSPEGGHLRRNNFRRRYWIPAIEAAGVGQVRFHDLRHTHVAMLIAQGEHVKVIADRIGHSSPNVTLSTYAHLFPGLDQEAADRLDLARQTDLRRTQSP